MSDERARLEIIKSIFGERGNLSSAARTLIGIASQDDAAVFQICKGCQLVISSDFIRGTQFYLFQTGHLDHFDVGFYLVAANLSDIAAMGAQPLGLTTVIRYGPGMSDEQFEQVFLGIREAAERYNVTIVGGDTGSYLADVFAATAFGVAEDGCCVLRSGAKRGDLLCVTGQIGLPITALAYFNRARHLGFSLSPTEEEDLLRAWKRPVPRIKEGLILSKHKIASSCQDISDGLKVTIEQIAVASGVTFTIHSERLPVHQSTKKVAEFFNIPFPQLAISASVDFQLLFTMPSTSQSFCDSLFASEGLAYHVIGDVNDINENLMVDVDGNIKSLPGVGWDHQSGDLLQQILGT